MKLLFQAALWRKFILSTLFVKNFSEEYFEQFYLAHRTLGGRLSQVVGAIFGPSIKYVK